MLLAAQRRDCPPWDVNPGGSLSWLLSSLALICVAVTAPLRLLLRKDRPENRWELLTFVVYAAILVSLSLPFVLLDWPPGRGWMDWPFDG